jgi:hypothetical protein
MKKILTAFLTFMAATSAHASPTSLIALNSEAVPGKTAYLGVDTNANNQINSIYYKGITGKVEQFSIPTLIRSQQVLFTQSGYDLITISLNGASSTAANLKLTYLKNAISGNKGVQNYKVSFNPHVHRYELYNSEGRAVQNGYIYTNRNALGMSVGISDVKTW